MATKKLQSILTKRLHLQQPQFVLELLGRRVIGTLISATFRGKADRQRQKMIWDALEAEFGAESVFVAGTLLAYTPEEWNMDLEGAPPRPITPSRMSRRRPGSAKNKSTAGVRK